MAEIRNLTRNGETFYPLTHEKAVIGMEDFKDTITEQIENYRPIEITGDVVNAPDEEDITSDSNNLLKFKNRNNLYGLGYIILRRDSSFASQVTQANTIYIIQYNFDLDSARINVPNGSILLFEGGTLSNGTLVCADQYDVRLVYYQDINDIFDNVTLEGNFIHKACDSKTSVDNVSITESGGILSVKDGGITGNKLSQGIVNSDDLSLVNNKIQLSNRETTNGMGYIILRKDQSFASQLTQTNTIYVIRYDFTISEDITIPDNCVLEFNGGSISGAYTITGTNTGISAGLVKIFNTNVLFDGTWNIDKIYPRWFGSFNDNTNDDTNSVERAINLCEKSSGKILSLCGFQYKLTQRLTINFSNFEIDGDGATIIWAGNGLDSLYTGVFQFIGSVTSTVTTVSLNEPAYTNTLTVSSASGFSIGDVIQINSEATSGAGMYTNIISKIVGISGNVITIDMVKRLPLTVSETVNVTKLNAVENVRIENCKFIATGQTSRSNGMGGIFFEYASNVFVRDCSFSGFWFKGVKTRRCTHVIIDTITVNKVPAFSGGEGYGIQYEYTYNSIIKNCYGETLRHLIDLACAWHIVIDDCFDAYTQQSSYSLHSSYEYDVIFNNCVAQGGITNTYAFALGSSGTGFADYTDNITLSGCRVYDFAGANGVRFVSKGKGLYMNNCIIEMRNGIVARCLYTANNDTFVTNSELIGGIEVCPATGIDYTIDGSISISNSKLMSQSSQRVLLIGTNAKIKLIGCILKGISTIGAGINVHAVGCKFLPVANEEFIVTNSSEVNGQKLYFDNCTFDTTELTKNSYSFVAEILSFSGCKFVLNTTQNTPWSLCGAKTRIISCEGLSRGVFNGAYCNDIEIVGCNATGVNGDRIIYVVGFTGKLSISNCRFNGTTRTNHCIDLSDSGNGIATLIFTNNTLSGTQKITDARVTRCVVTGNLIDGVSSSCELPTAGTNKFVENNLIYIPS